MNVERLTENLVSAQEPSGNPFDLLPLRQFLVLVAKAHRRPMNAVAKVLRISRDTLYDDLHAAEATLRQSAGQPGRQGAERCAECGREPRLPGRRVGRACRNAWFRTYQNRRRRKLGRKAERRGQPDTVGVYHCPAHAVACPLTCQYLCRWRARFDAEHRPPRRRR